MFVDDLAEIPPGGVTVFSAHGVAKRVEDVARERGLPVIDATCPLVAKVHTGRPPLRCRSGREVDARRPCRPRGGRDGTIGQIPDNMCISSRRWPTSPPSSRRRPRSSCLRYADHAVGRRHPARSSPPWSIAFPVRSSVPDVRDICYATQNRQQSVHDLAKLVDLILVVGSKNSSNSNRLARDRVPNSGKPSYSDRRCGRPGRIVVPRGRPGRSDCRRKCAGDVGAGE